MSMANLALQSPQKSTRPDLGLALRRNGTIYALSLLLVAAAFILRALLAPTLGNQALYLFLVPPVLIAGVLGGWGPGLMTTILSLIVHLYATGEGSNLIHPSEPLFAAELTRAATFVALGIGIAWFGERLRTTRLDASSASARTARPFRWSLRSGKCDQATNASSPDSFAI
jgi:two-component system, LuxR family, sensor kinase FixL